MSKDPQNRRTRQILQSWRRLRRNRLSLIGGAILLVIILLALLAPLLAPHDPLKQNFELISRPSNSAHWLGTDQLGRDILSRIFYGARYTLFIAVSAVLMGFLVGVSIGMGGGFYGGKIDLFCVYLADILLSFPGILLALAVIAAIGPGPAGVVIASGFSSIPQFLRLTRSVVLVEKEKLFVLAARSIGESNLSIMLRYILPNILGSLIVLLTLRMAAILLIASGLSFLGLGVQPPYPEWGAMLSEGRKYLQAAPHICIFPGGAIMLLVLSFNLLGDGLRDALDPRMKI
jgi:peptide/nickel transport system permease protein